jgi:hypothetical protein
MEQTFTVGFVFQDLVGEYDLRVNEHTPHATVSAFADAWAASIPGTTVVYVVLKD